MNQQPRCSEGGYCTPDENGFCAECDAPIVRPRLPRFEEPIYDELERLADSEPDGFDRLHEPPPEHRVPESIHSGTIKLGSHTLKVHQLDNGERVIEAESFRKFVDALGDGSLELPTDDAVLIAELKKLNPNFELGGEGGDSE